MRALFSHAIRSRDRFSFYAISILFVLATIGCLSRLSDLDLASTLQYDCYSRSACRLTVCVRPRNNSRVIFGEAGPGLPCEDQSCDIVNQWPAESLLFRGGLLAGLTRRSFVLL